MDSFTPCAVQNTKEHCDCALFCLGTNCCVHYKPCLFIGLRPAVGHRYILTSQKQRHIFLVVAQLVSCALIQKGCRDTSRRKWTKSFSLFFSLKKKICDSLKRQLCSVVLIKHTVSELLPRAQTAVVLQKYPVFYSVVELY